MASNQSYLITVKNNITEKEGINLLLNSKDNFILPDSKSKKSILTFLGVSIKYIRAFDLILLPNYLTPQEEITIENVDDITLVELKTTKKKLTNIPRGFFFGATENEFNLARKIKEKYKFCFVSLHKDSLGYELLSLSELEKIIKNKRIQYQINL
ncbi:hypothetical protein [Lutibacter flavus]|uniref:Uncharacterized protein n=1 Tax=Lutibacter flavus TaxID=691689 RepID=A0A238XJU3_9FLAO|nr:hypothetical protein [Lutibacter flavus]SNR58851.1 hypothetical protein SAMN04488111_1865 [Lutibacter flavus]